MSTTTIPNFPLVDQLNSPTSDDQPDENKWTNCVVASLVAAIRALTGLSAEELNPDMAKDAVEGQGYTGFTSAGDFVAFAARYGCKLYAIDGNNAYLVSQAHQHIQAGHPVLCTEPDPYVDTSKPQYKDWTHVCVWMAEQPGALTAMDPFHAHFVTKTDEAWITLISFRQIWIVEKTAMNTQQPISTPAVRVPAGWHDDGTTLTASNGVPVVHGFRDYVLSHNWDPNDLPVAAEYGTQSLESSNPSLGAGTQQVFNFSLLGWTPVLGVIREYAGKELLATRQNLAKYYQLYKKLATQQPPAPDPKIAELESENAKLQAEITRLKTAVEQVNLILQGD